MDRHDFSDHESAVVLIWSLQMLNIPAKIVSFSREIVTPWKQDIILSCRRVGIPTAQVIWRLHDRILETNGRKQINKDGSLLIKDIQHNNEGNYTCSVENTHGRDEIVYSIKVRVPPDAPTLTVVASYADSLQLQWTDNHNGGSPILGYVINYKRDHGDWEELQIEAQADSHMLHNLWCGTRYQLYITAFNKIGTGLPCDIVNAYTKGTVPVKPKQSQLLTVNSTVVTIWLDAWGDGGCAILYFIIEYRESQRTNEWTLVSNNVQPTERVYSVLDLSPASKYHLRVTAHNNAGSTLAYYNFTTLTAEGVIDRLLDVHTVLSVSATVSPELAPPVSHSREMPFYANIKIIIPLIISITLLPCLVGSGVYITKKHKTALKWENHPRWPKCKTNKTGTSSTWLSGLGDSRKLSVQTPAASRQTLQVRDQQYLAVRVGGQLQALSADSSSFKTDSACKGPAVLICQDRRQQQALGADSSSFKIESACKGPAILICQGRRQQQALGADSSSFKTDSAYYIEDICPYATFQLSKPPYSESTYSGNVYSGPYHSVRGSFVYHDPKPSGAETYKFRHAEESDESSHFVCLQQQKEPEYTKVRRKGGRLRDPHSESQESDNLGSTDSEVKKILTLHLPISEYDTLGSDSEGETPGGQVAASQELVSFRHRMGREVGKSGVEESSSSSETSPSGGARKPFPSRKSKSKSQMIGKRQVRSSSGYSSHTEETTFSFSDRIHPPSLFSDSHSHELSEAECDMRRKSGRSGAPPRLSRETSFQIDV
uniref:(California timema) hypothetical protein n=1 Tax=Timema californicum TaxID=61474 RepID=A0A7R9P892_TIMCA|nr:unnamed protein product [Timema californicum]